MTALADSLPAQHDRGSYLGPGRGRWSGRGPLAGPCRGPVRGGPGPVQDHPVLAAAAAGLPRRRRGVVRLGRASRRRPGSGGSPRCRASGPRSTWTRPSPSRSASRPTRPTRCAPGWQPTSGSAPGPASSPSGPRSAPSRSAWPARSPTTSWSRLASPRAVGHHHRRVLPAGPGPGHGDRAGPHAARRRRGRGPPDGRSAGPTAERSPGWSAGDQPADQPDQDHGTRTTGRTSPPARTSKPPRPPGPAGPPSPAKDLVPDPPRHRNVQAVSIARELAAAGKPVSRRALRNGGVKGSNESLNALARLLNAELADEQAIVP